jgi:hypothetical protein
MSADAICPLPNCTSPLLLVRSFVISITDEPGAYIDPVAHGYVDSWEVVCEGGGHTVDGGGVEEDGRAAVHGYRAGQSLGGVR